MNKTILQIVQSVSSLVIPVFGQAQEVPKPLPKPVYLDLNFRAPEAYERGDFDSFPCDQFMRDRAISPYVVRLTGSIPSDWDTRETSMTIRDFFGAYSGKTYCTRHYYLGAFIPIPYPYSFGLKPQKDNFGWHEKRSAIGYSLSTTSVPWDGFINEKDEEPVFKEEVISQRKIRFSVKNCLNGGSGLISIDGGISFYNLIAEHPVDSKDPYVYLVDLEAVPYKQSDSTHEPPVLSPLPKVPTPVKVLLMGARGWRIFTQIYTWGKGWEKNPQTVPLVKKVQKRVQKTTISPDGVKVTTYEDIWVEQ